MPTLATFNANNFFLRYRFSPAYPGAASDDSKVEEARELVGFLPGTAFRRYPKSYIVWDDSRRKLAARALREPDGELPDILCFQEVENIHAIRLLNQKYLDDAYTYSMLIDSYDPRNIDVGLLSKFPLREIRSHVDDADEDGKPVFSRDCLEVEVDLPDGEILTLFVNHLKSKFVRRKSGESDENFHRRKRRSHDRRKAQAERVAKYVEERFTAHEHQHHLYAVIGDFNDTPTSPYVRPLVDSPRLADVISTHRPKNDRWTYYWRSRDRVSQIDYVLVSKALAVRVAAEVGADPGHVPHIERRGVGYRKLNASGEVLPKKPRFTYFEADEVTTAPPGAELDERIDFRFDRYTEVMEDWKSNVSDHCPVKVWF